MICLFPFPFLVMYTANPWRPVSEGQRLDSFSKRNLHEGHAFTAVLALPRETLEPKLNSDFVASIGQFTKNRHRLAGL